MESIECRRSGQRGFSIVELMIASAISLAITAALTTVFVGNTRSRTELDRSHQQIENGRYALELLSDELRVAGFYGELPLAGVLQSEADACATSAAQLGWQTAPLRVPVPVQAVAGGPGAPACLSDRAAGTAAIALRRLSTDAIAPSAALAPDEYLQTSRCKNDPPSAKLVIGAAPGDFLLRNLACDAPMPVRRILQRTYYIAACSNCGSDTIPSLARAELVGGAIEVRTMVEGIEAMGVDFGFDIDADGATDRWQVTLDGIVGSPGNDWQNVMAVRLHLLSRTLRPTAGHIDTRRYELGTAGSAGPFSDGFKRRVYTGVIRLNNPSGRREL
jgi:type IV pilus assembly protein PilW